MGVGPGTIVNLVLHRPSQTEVFSVALQEIYLWSGAQVKLKVGDSAFVSKTSGLNDSNIQFEGSNVLLGYNRNRAR